MGEDFGDFEEVSEGIGKTKNMDGPEMPVRVRLPRKGELIGLIVQRYGGNRMEVSSVDGKSRNCRVPGRFKKSLWLRPGDFVLIVPWPDDEGRGDVVFKYTGAGVNQLRKRGLLNTLKKEF